MNAFIALLRKDLVLHFSNRRAVLMSLVAPILIAAFFGSLFGGRDNGPARIPVALSDLDQSALSRRTVANMQADPALVVTELGVADAQAQVRAGKQRAAVTLPAGFGVQATQALFGRAAKPKVVLLFDPSQAMVLPMLRGLLAQHVMRAVGAGAGPGGAAFALDLPFATRAIEAVSQLGAHYNSYAHSFAGMGVQFILLMGVDMGVGLLLLRRMGLWQRLRAAPLSRVQLLGSRIASCALIALIVFGVVYGVAMAFFGVRVSGSVPGFIAVLLAFSMLTASFGLMIAALGRTPEATRALAILATLLLVMLGGAWVPSFVFPPWLQDISRWVPTHWAVAGLDAMTWRGQGLQEAVVPVAAMLGFTALFAAIALWRFRWQE